MSWLEDVKFIDELHGVAVGSNGTIQDGRRRSDASTGTLRVVCMLEFVDTLRGYIVGARGIVSVLTMVELRGRLKVAMRTCLGLPLQVVTMFGSRRSGKIIYSKDGGQSWSYRKHHECIVVLDSLSRWK
jgi:photosystem II stability/assembly factor-like uncharacterized protein